MSVFIKYDFLRYFCLYLWNSIKICNWQRIYIFGKNWWQCGVVNRTVLVNNLQRVTPQIKGHYHFAREKILIHFIKLNLLFDSVTSVILILIVHYNQFY